MVLLKGGTLLNLLVVFVAYFGYRCLQLRSDIMINKLQDTTSLFPSSTNSLTYISFLKKKKEPTSTTNADSDENDDDETTMAATYASKLYDIVSKQSTFGQIEYLGKCVAVVIKSTQFESKTCDFMMISSWSTKQEFLTFQSSKPMKDMWHIHNAQRYQRSSIQTIFISIVTQGLLPLWTRMYSTITGFKYNLNIQPTLEEEAAKTMPHEKRGGGSRGEIHSTPERIQALTKQILGDEAGDGAASNQANNNEPIYIFNWMNSGTMSKEEQKKNYQYKWEFTQMLVTFGGGPIHYGPIIPSSFPNNGNNDEGNFAEFGAVYYPSRKFFLQLLQSKFLREVIQNKRPGEDSLAVLTTPYVVR